MPPYILLFTISFLFLSLFSTHILVTGRFSPFPIRTPGRFGPIPFWSGRFGQGRFGSILGVGRFGPILVGHFGPLILFSYLDEKSFLSS